MEIVTYIAAHAMEIVEAAAALVAALVLIAKLTPNQKDDKILAKVQDKVDIVLEFLKSRRNG